MKLAVTSVIVFFTVVCSRGQAYTEPAYPELTYPEPAYSGPRKRECIPYSMWKEDCKLCVCNGNYQRHCSTVACNRELLIATVEGLEPRRKVFENETHCTPDTQFYLACNPCYCQKSGIKSGSRCTNSGCPPFPPSYNNDAKCVPEMSFKDDCNNCICGESGIVRDSHCTKMGCLYPHP